MATPAADHTTGMIAEFERPCARKPAMPKPAAKIAAITRCSVTELSVAAGTDARQRAARQHQHVGIGAHRPFGEHDEDQAAPPRRPRRSPPTRARRPTALPRLSSAKAISARSAWSLDSTISIAPNR